jgi:hypothetical protein
MIVSAGHIEVALHVDAHAIGGIEPVEDVEAPKPAVGSDQVQGA